MLTNRKTQILTYIIISLFFISPLSINGEANDSTDDLNTNSLNDKNSFVKQPRFDPNPRSHKSNNKQENYVQIPTGSNDDPVLVKQGISQDLPITASALDLPDAVDNTNYTYTTGGDVDWVYQTSVSHDGVDAAASGPITKKNANSWLETTITGKGIVEFWWRFDTFSADYLEFSVNGTIVESTQTYTWAMVRYLINVDGEHTLRWTNTEDQTSSNHIVYVDQFTFYAGVTMKLDFVSPTSSSIWMNQSAHEISWANEIGPSGQRLNIYLYKGGVQYATLTTSAYLINNDFNWNIPSTIEAGTDYQIKIEAWDNASLYQLSDYFEIRDALDYGEAVDAPYLEFTSYGVNPFGTTVETTYDGIDSVYNGLLSSSSYSRLNTTVEGEGDISFYWKLYGISTFYTYRFYVDGVIIKQSSTTFDWQQETIQINNTGSHELIWEISATSFFGISFGGWLDNVTWVPGEDSINMITPTSSSKWLNNTQYEIQWQYSGNFSDVSIELYKNSVFDSTISASTPNDKSYLWVVPNTLSTDADYQIKLTSTTNSSVTVFSDFFNITQLTIAEAVDYVNEYTYGGDGNWKGDLLDTQDGLDSIHTDVLGDSNKIWLNMTVTDNGLFSFYWKVSSEVDDYFSLYINDTLISRISGEIDWTLFEYIIEESGEHSISWMYEKDSSGSSGTDNAWIDLVSFDASVDSVQITSPLENSNWLTNSTKLIQWKKNGPSTDVYIQLWKSNSFLMNITDSTLNDGSYSWFLPIDQLSGTDYQIKIISMTDSNVADISNYFEITEIDYMLFVNPNTATSWYTEATNSITWGFGGDILNVVLELYKGGIFLQTISALTANDGSYSWVIPAALAAGIDYAVKIYDSSNSSNFDMSDMFTLLKPTISISNPIMTSNWVNGSYEYINWTWTGDFLNVRISLYESGTFQFEITSGTANDGSFLWYLPTNLAAGTYTINVNSTTDDLVWDISDEFTINYPIDINLAVDNSDLSFSTSSLYPFFGQQSTSYDTIDSASSYPGETVAIDSWLQTSVSGDGILWFYWKSNVDPANPANFLIDGVINTSISGLSDWQLVNLTISGPSTKTIRWEYNPTSSLWVGLRAIWVDQIVWKPFPDSVNVTSPTSIDTMAVGGTYDLIWISLGTFTSVDIDLYKGGAFVQNIASGYTDTESYSWLVPSLTAGVDYQIRVIATTNASAYDYSENFAIESTPLITITNPMGSSDWEELTYQTISWSTTGTVISTVDIDLFLNDVFIMSIASGIPNNGSLNWLIPSILDTSTQYQVRVTASDQNAFTTISTYFLIDDIPVITITQPTTGSVITNGSISEISWTWNGTFTEVTIELWKGGVYNQTIIGSTTNDGSYVWSVPSNLDIGSDYQIVIFDPNNVTISTITVSFVIEVRIPLQQALDTSIVIGTSGNSDWFGQTSDSYFDGDSARSGVIGDGESSIIQFTVDGSGTISFYWKVSSSATDYLIFKIDGVTIYQISGEVAWTYVEYYISDPASLHTITIGYVKDGSIISGYDAGWVDYLIFSADLDNIVINNPTGGENWSVGSQTINWDSNGAVHTVTIELFANGSYWGTLASNLANTGSWIWNIDNSFMTGTGYSIRIINDNNVLVYADSNTFSLVVYNINEAIDNYDVAISTSGNGVWTYDTVEFVSDGDAITLTDIFLGEGYLDIQVYGTGIVSFYYKLSGDGNVYFKLDGSSKKSIYSEANWTLFVMYITTPGWHTVQIDFDAIWSADQVWIDNFEFMQDTNSIEITTPSNSAALVKNEQYQINWQANGTIDFVKIDLYYNGVFMENIVANISSLGPYYWTLSNYTNSDLYSIRVTYLDNLGIFGEISITITSPSLQITSPLGGEKWEIWDFNYITWNLVGTSYIIIQLFSSGVFYSNITLSGTNGQYSWYTSYTIPIGPNYQIKLIYSSDESLVSWSGYFEIIEERTITVTTPTSGTQYSYGDTITISWTWTSEIPYVKIEFYNSSVAYIVIELNITNTGSYDWIIPTELSYGVNYRIRISYSPDPSHAYDFSSYFEIVPPLEATIPMSAQYGNGTSFDITWVSNGVVNNLKIELYVNGSFDMLIIASTPNDGTYTWLIPSDIAISGNYSIKLTGVENMGITAMSNTFTIFAVLTVENAIDNDNIQYQQGSNPWFGQTSYSYLGSGSLQSADIGNSGRSEITFTVYGSGTVSFWWMVDSELNFDYLYVYFDGGNYLRISGSQSWAYIEHYFDTSGPHTINFQYRKDSSLSSGLDAGWIDVLVWNPNPDGVIIGQVGDIYPTQSMDITWDYNGTFASVTLELWINNTLITTISGSTTNDGSFTWVVPTNLLTSPWYSIKIIHTENSSVNDMSVYFEIYKYISPNEALDNPNITVSTSWIGIEGESYIEGDALMTPQLSSYSSSSVTITVLGSGTLSFWWADTTYYFSVYLDGSLKYQRYGGFSWDLETIEISTDGTHIITWVYEIYSATSNDTAWIDGIIWTPTPKTLSVDDPNSSDEFDINRSYNINWTSTGEIPYVDIHLLLDGEIAYVIATNYDNTGAYTWLVPETLTVGLGYQIRVLDSSNDTLYDDSEVFSIIEIYEIEITDPMSGTYQQGETMTISWLSSINIDVVTIELYKSDVFVLTLFSGIENNNSINWEIPTDLATGDDYQIRISSTQGNVDDYSDYFEIEQSSNSSKGNQSSNSQTSNKDNPNNDPTPQGDTVIIIIVILTILLSGLGGGFYYRKRKSS